LTAGPCPEHNHFLILEKEVFKRRRGEIEKKKEEEKERDPKRRRGTLKPEKRGCSVQVARAKVEAAKRDDVGKSVERDGGRSTGTHRRVIKRSGEARGRAARYSNDLRRG